LLARRTVDLTAVQHGGGQERDVRSGTLNVAAVAGFAAAVEVAVRGLDRYQAKVGGLREALVDGIAAVVPDAVVLGAAQPVGRLPGVASVRFPGCSADALLMLLDAAGIDCAAGSACSAGVAQASHVLLAMGLDETTARSVLRFSLAETNDVADVQTLLGVLPEAVRRARAAAAYA
jgi:cysteine desulfurase